MATFKKLTDLDGNPIWINLDRVQLMYREPATTYLPERTRIVFGWLPEVSQDDEEEQYRVVQELPHVISEG